MKKMMKKKTAKKLKAMKNKQKTVIIGVCGGIAAYKVCDLVSHLVKDGLRVEIVMTEAAKEFVTPLSLSTLSGIPVHCDMFKEQQGDTAEVEHIAIGDRGDLMVIVPASADIMAKAAHGIADDLLSTVILAADSPVMYFPAMNTRMWQHPATRQNVDILRQRGFKVINPDSGMLACGTEGEGRLGSVDSIEKAVLEALAEVGCEQDLNQDFYQDLEGKTVLISAGPTEEPIDPVRCITNRSSGKMGYALAEAALSRGAKVNLVSGPVAVNPPEDKNLKMYPVKTALEMQEIMEKLHREADITIMAAAVGDYRVKEAASQKLKKTGKSLKLELVQNPDILAGLGAHSHGLLAGFAAETENLKENAVKKLKSKGAHMIIANDVTAEGCGFGSDNNRVTVFDNEGSVTELPLMPKDKLAHALLDIMIKKINEIKGE